MKQISGDHRPLAAAGDLHAHVTWCVTGRRDQPNTRDDLVWWIDQLDEPRVDHGLDGLFVNAPLSQVELDAQGVNVVVGFLRRPRRKVTMRSPIFVLLVAEQMASVQEGRMSSVAVRPRLPSHVVDVQVGAQHVINGLRSGSEGAEPVEERRVQVVPRRHDRDAFSVAYAGVDHDCDPLVLHEESLDVS